MSGSIHVINVLRIQSSRNVKYLPSSFPLLFSRILLVLLARRPAVRACKLCPGRAISATTSVSTGESTGRVLRRARKTQRKSGLVFQRANSTFLLRRNQSADCDRRHILENV